MAPMHSAYPACRKDSELRSWRQWRQEKPIVAARAAAVPEIVRRGVLVEPENAEALAEGIWQLWSDSTSRTIARQQRLDVKKYEMIRVARLFLQEVATIAT